MSAGPVLRILDANANRAREALRVLEDAARFALDDDGLSAALKELRHDLAAATRDTLAQAILFRDTPGDVGTGHKTEAEGRRAGLADVATAAGKRLGEALRAIEEALKVLDPPRAGAVEAVRYRFYDVEQRLARRLRPASRMADVRLYVLVTEDQCRRPWLEAAEEAILGGADCLQLREKGLEGGELLRRARQLVALCRRYDVLSIINDRPDVAVLSGADGVHVGQEDLPAIEARRIVGPDRIVGVSTHELGQARSAVADGADYIGVGPVFRSATKPRDFVAGLTYCREVAQHIGIPAVAIAGITAENVGQVIETGLRAVAVTAAVIGAPDVRAAAEQIRRALTAAPAHAASPKVGQTFLSAMPGGSAVGQAFLPTAPGQSAVGQTFLSAVPGHSCPGTTSRAVDAGGQECPPASGSSVPPTDREHPSFEGPVLERRRRRLPHWTLAGSTYFLTFRVAHGALSPGERTLVLDHLRAGHGRFYTLLAAVVMPDHVHVLLRPGDGLDLPRITKGIKGVSARLVNQARGAQGKVWQDESFDRIVRDQAELDEKLRYMLNNPGKRGLTDDPWEYPWWHVEPERSG